MNIERIQRQAELLEAHDNFRKTELGAQALLTELRLATDPLLVESFTDLDLSRVSELAILLRKSWEEARRLKQRINRLKIALGE